MAYAAEINQIAQAPLDRVGPKTTTREVDGWTMSGVVRAGDFDGSAEPLTPSGLTIDEYALARCVSSEYGSHQPQYMLAAAECIRNAAALHGFTGPGGVFRQLTFEKKEARLKFKGKYGEQTGRIASTRIDPGRRHLIAAQLCLTAKTAIAGGATAWFEPSVQDEGYQGKRKLNYDAVGIVQKWAKDGLQWVGQREDINPYTFMGFIHVGKVDTAPALAAIEEGRRGRKPGQVIEGPWKPFAVAAGSAALCLGMAALK